MAWVRTSILTAALALVASCAEREEILTGEREAILPALRQASPDIAPPAATLPAISQNQNAAQAPGNPATRTAHPALASAPTLAWTASIGQGDSRKTRVTAAPVIVGDRVYTLDAVAQITAFDTAGTVIWQRNLDQSRGRAPDATGGGLSADGGALYASLGQGRLVSLDAATGEIRWEQRLDATGTGRPLVQSGIVYLTAGDDTGWAIDANSGRILWQLEAAQSVANVLGAPSPVAAGGLVIFPFGAGGLQAVLPLGGLRRWSSSVLGERTGLALSKIGDITGAPFVQGDRLYVGNQSGRTVAIDVQSGERVWTAREGATSDVLAAGNSVYLVNELGEFLRLDAETGAVLWRIRLPGFVTARPRRISEVFMHHGPVIAGGALWVASGDGVLRSFDPTTGAAQAEIALPGGATTRPVVANGTLYVVSRRGQLLAYR